ncbi:TPM domain-containing protein [Lederbergia graminis]|uniref:TPM domain-containing protein n=1 Tax=Lederbergia graminis TaxID=735518 RepID=A0ABW0LDG5_9BACI
MRKSPLLLLFSLFCLLFIPIQFVSAASIPTPVGDIYVQDFANVLSTAEEQELIELGIYLDDHTGAQIAVLTVDSLDGIPVEQYAVQALREYGLGDANKNNGILLLLSIQDRKIFIEVGYGLEGRLPDGKVGSIIDSYALPSLDEGNIPHALTNTYKKLFNEVAEEYQLDKQANAEGYVYGANPENEGPSLFTTIIIAVIIIGLIILDFKFLGGVLTLSLFRMLAIILSRGGGGGGGGPRTGGGGSAGGGGAGRSW